MNGIVKNVNQTKMFGFIKAEGNEYFFHRSDLCELGAWTSITMALQNKMGVNVSFDAEKTPKGLRARNVSIES
jgi:cold shock CspA family protein